MNNKDKRLKLILELRKLMADSESLSLDDQVLNIFQFFDNSSQFFDNKIKDFKKYLDEEEHNAYMPLMAGIPEPDKHKRELHDKEIYTRHSAIKTVRAEYCHRFKLNNKDA